MMTGQVVHSALNLLRHRQGRDLNVEECCFVYPAGDETNPLNI